MGKITSMIGAHFNKDHPFFPWEIKSLDEKGIQKKVVEFGREWWLQHHKFLLTRVYPKGTRFDSSNYNPFPGWSIGA
jgi:phosphatidylinositol phospholipase C delta